MKSIVKFSLSGIFLSIIFFWLILYFSSGIVEEKHGFLGILNIGIFKEVSSENTFMFEEGQSIQPMSNGCLAPNGNCCGEMDCNPGDTWCQHNSCGMYLTCSSCTSTSTSTISTTTSTSTSTIGWSNVTAYINQTNITYPQSVVINCTVRDANTSSTISNYHVWIYDNPTLLTEANTDKNGNVSYTYQPSAATASHNINCNITNNVTLNYNAYSNGTATLTVNKGSVNLLLTSNISWNTSHPNASNVTGYGCPTNGASDFTCTLYRNTSGLVAQGKPMANETILLGAGSHLYVWNMSNANPANWTFNSTNNTLSVTSLAKVDQIILNSSTIYNGTSARISCNIKDYYTNDSLSGYNVSFYNDTFLGNSTTNSTGWAIYDYSDYTSNLPQTINLKCNITNQPNLYYNASADNSKNITLNVINLGVQAFANPTTISFGNTVLITANITNNVSAIDSVIANISYTNITNGILVGAFETKSLTFNQSFSGTDRQYNLTYMPPKSGNYNVIITANASRLSSNVTNFSINFGQPSITFTFPNYRVMANQTFNVSINLSSTYGDVWYTNLTLGITNQSVMNITQNENFSSQLYNVSNNSTTTVKWSVNSLNEGLTIITVDATPINGSSVQEYEPHRVLYPLLLVAPSITNVSLNATLRTIIIGNTSSINSINLTVTKAYSQDTDSAASAFTQNLSEMECTGESLGNMRVTLLDAGAYSYEDDGNLTIDNIYNTAWSSGGDLFIFLNSSYTIDRFSIYWKNASSTTGNVTIYYNTSSGWSTISSLSNLTPPINKSFTNISGFNPIVTNAFKLNQTAGLVTTLYEFAAYQVQGRTDKCYLYDFNFSNTTQSGNYSFNVSVQTQNSVLSMSANSNSTFFVNFGSPIIYISASDILLTNYNETYNAIVTASNGDLRNLTLNLNIFNQSVLNITPKETLNETISEILSSNSDSRNWTVGGITDGLTNTSVFVNSSTGEGNYSSSYFTINVTSLPGDLPNVTNFWFNYSGALTNITNLYTNLTIYANVSDDVSLKTAIANITYPDNNSTNVTMTGTSCRLPQWCTWKYTFGGSNLPLNMTGSYTVRIVSMDIGNQEKPSGVDAGSPENMTFNVYNSYTLNLTSNYTSYMRGENVTVQASDVNGFTANSVKWIVKITKINDTYNFSAQSTTFNYTIQPSDPEGNYSIIANVSKDNNTGNNAWQFNVSRTFTITDVSVMPSINPSINSILNIQANLNNARNARYNSSVSGNLFCINSSGQYQMFEFKFTNGSASLIGQCISPVSYSTPFNITINVSDEYNNSGQYIINLTTEQPASFASGGGGGSGGGSGGGNITIIQNVTVNGTQEIRDFNITFQKIEVQISRGEDETVVGAVSNSGNTNLIVSSSIILNSTCCVISIVPSEFQLKVGKAEIPFTVSIHVNTSSEPDKEYFFDIKFKSEALEKSDRIKVIVKENPVISNLQQVSGQVSEIENKINQYKKVGLNVVDLEGLLSSIKQMLSGSQTEINKDDINTLKTNENSVKVSLTKINDRLNQLAFVKIIYENKWNITATVIAIVITSYVVIQVVYPYIKLGKEIRTLDEEQQSMVKTRIETEKQYFMRKINEETFSGIMIEKQGKIIRMKADIKRKSEERSTLMRQRLHPLSMLRWFKNGILKVSTSIKSLPRKIKERLKNKQRNLLLKS